MAPRIKAKTATVVTGVVLELSNDDATHLSFFLRTAVDGTYDPSAKKYINKWPWAKRFVEELDRQRGTGCTMGPRANTDTEA